MADDHNDWVQDLKRWVQNGLRNHADGDDAADAVGYEAADPALLARQWPDAPSAIGVH
ncbi:MAG: hypothetical protein JSR59_06955 [Proteobacteria bacterium]|nr:hypothetical protein [Pseudomonadota bacterium]